MNRRKSILLAALIVLLLTFSVSGTIAWLATKTQPITNTFTPAKLETSVNETFTNNEKSSITVVNEADSVSAYVRVRLVANWVDASGAIVAPANITVNYNETNWTESGDYYYYKSALAAGVETENLLASSIKPEGAPDNTKLQVVVLHQSIQAEGGAVDSATNWNIVNPAN